MAFLTFVFVFHAPVSAGATEFIHIPASYLSAQQCRFGLLDHADAPAFTSPAVPSRLTRFWAQEAIGTPEVHHFLNREGLSLRAVPTGIIDLEFTSGDLDVYVSGPSRPFRWRDEVHTGTHGNNVALVINGAFTGVTNNAQISTLFYGDRIAAVGNLLVDEGKGPEIYNRSLTFPDSMTLAGVLEKELREVQQIYPDSSPIFVNSAGNDYATGVVGLESDLRMATLPVILVAAVTSDGKVSDYSAGGPQVLISAPSSGPGFLAVPQRQVLSNLDFFGGTSGAAPMVTGALVAAMGLLEGLTVQEARTLLQRTSFRTARGFPEEGPSFGGHGVLNYYKLMRVAHRLKMRGWPNSRHLISDPGEGTIYDFKLEAQEVKDAAENYLSTHGEATCVDKVKVLSELRQAFFLDSDNVGVRQAIYSLYVNEGYHDQALYFSPLGVRFHGSGAYSPSLLERSLLSTVAAGEYLEALKILSQRNSLDSSPLESEVLKAIMNLIATRPYEGRAELLHMVLQHLGAEMKSEATLSILKETLPRADIGLLKDFLEFGFELDPVTYSLSLRVAVAYGDLEKTRLLLETAPSSGAAATLGLFTALQEAVRLRDLNSFRNLLKLGAEDELYAVLKAASKTNNTEMLEWMVKASSTEWHGITPLKNSIVHGDVELLRLLLVVGADPNEIRGEITPLMEAAMYGDLEMVQVLMEFGADVNMKNKFRKSAHDYALTAGHLEIADLLKANSKPWWKWW